MSRRPAGRRVASAGRDGSRWGRIAAGLCAFPVLLVAACDAGASLRGVRVIDGDTLDLQGERVRIANIDTPERGERARCARERALADTATTALRRAVEASGSIRLHREGVDRYGRTLARVELDGRDVGEDLIAAGLAVRWGNGRPDWCS